MLSEALRAPLADRRARDGLAIGVGLVLLALVLVRVARGLWPDPLSAVPVVLLAVPVLLFGGHLGAVLGAHARESAPPPFEWSTDRLRIGARVVAVAVAYLLPPVVVAVGTVAAVLGGDGTGPLAAVAPTVALLAGVAVAYLLPAALAAAVRDGVRAGLSPQRLGGTASGAYFVAWAGAATMVVLAWGALAATERATPAAVLAAGGFAYAHLVAARLVGTGLARSNRYS